MSFAARAIPLYGADPYPNASVALDFVRGFYKAPGAAGGSLSSLPGWSFSRTGVEYEATSAGLLVPFASGVPAVTDLGLQVWEARTNYVQASQAFTASSWSAGTPTGLTDNVAVAPDGTNTAASWSGGGRLFQDLAAAGNAAYSAQMYIKTLSGSPSVVLVIKDKITDVIRGTTTQSSTNSWQPIKVQNATTAGASTGARFEVGVSGGTVLLWQGDLQAGAFIGPPIANPSNVASATRGAASASVTFNTAGAGTLYIEGNTALSGTQALAGIQKSDGTEAVSIYTNGTTPTAQADAGGVTVAALTGAALSAGQTAKIAFAYAANDFAASFNGGAVQTDVSGALPNLASSSLQIGGFRAGFLANADGAVKRAIWWPSRLSNAQLQQMTT